MAVQPRDAARASVPMHERYSFPTAIEGLVKGLGPLFTEQTRAKLKAAGLDLGHLPPAIPAADMRGYFSVMAADIYPHLNLDDALRSMGVQFIRGWQGTMLGSAVSAALRLIGPTRTLPRLDRAFRTSDNFTISTTELTSEREALISLNDVANLPTYWEGIFQGGLEMLGFPQGTVELLSYEKPGAKFRLRW